MSDSGEAFHNDAYRRAREEDILRAAARQKVDVQNARVHQSQVEARLARENAERKRIQDKEYERRRQEKQQADNQRKIDKENKIAAKKARKATSKAKPVGKAPVKGKQASEQSVGEIMTGIIVLIGAVTAGYVANIQGQFEGWGIPIFLGIGGGLAYALRDLIKIAAIVGIGVFICYCIFLGVNQ